MWLNISTNYIIAQNVAQYFDQYIMPQNVAQYFDQLYHATKCGSIFRPIISCHKMWLNISTNYIIPQNVAQYFDQLYHTTKCGSIFHLQANLAHETKIKI